MRHRRNRASRIIQLSNNPSRRKSPCHNEDSQQWLPFCYIGLRCQAVKAAPSAPLSAHKGHRAQKDHKALKGQEVSRAPLGYKDRQGLQK